LSIYPLLTGCRGEKAAIRLLLPLETRARAGQRVRDEGGGKPDPGPRSWGKGDQPARRARKTGEEKSKQGGFRLSCGIERVRQSYASQKGKEPWEGEGLASN